MLLTCQPPTICDSTPPSFSQRRSGPNGSSTMLRDVQVVRAIEVAERLVQVVVLGDVDPQRAVAVGIAGDPGRLRQRVADAELESVREAPIEPRLQRVVLAVADRRDQAGLSRAAELLVQLAARLSAADRRPVQLPEAELIDLACADVRRLARRSPTRAPSGTRRSTTGSARA